MNKFCKLFIILGIYMFVFSSISYAGFEDVKGHWCEEQINSFYESEFVDGYDDGTFRPDRDITRAELCKIINRYMGYEVSGEWQEANLAIANEKAYLTNGTANSYITREEAFVVLSKAMNIDNIEFELTYKDADEISIWALPSVKSLTFMEYLKGYENNQIRPLQNITRAEVISILYNYVGIGGVDEDIDDKEFVIGYLSHNKYGLEFIEIDDELEMQSGDSITLAAMVEEDEDEVSFDIHVGGELIEFDEESLNLEAISSGKVELTAYDGRNNKTIIINIK